MSNSKSLMKLIVADMQYILDSLSGAETVDEQHLRLSQLALLAQGHSSYLEETRKARSVKYTPTPCRHKIPCAGDCEEF